MKFKKVMLVRDIENPEKYVMEEIQVGFFQWLLDETNYYDFMLSISIFCFVFSLVLGTILGFIYIIKTYFI
ncbi:hypothetical protein [Sedimentibacter sp.]|uniref:hypothetical protein n=1 Tax=Sedimentibacter sp. TaxID=1960295 RepID=UPI00289B6410|nr:hypothetical protein [Sedimentibacter sp.]